MHHKSIRHTLPAILLTSLLFPFALCADSKSVTIGPDNRTPPTVNFYSNTAGETHQLTVNIESGWRFVTGPKLEVNPLNLWSGPSGNTFNMLSLGNLDGGSGKAKVEATVVGTIRRVDQGGEGGGGTVDDLSFTVNMLTRYFSINFKQPFESRSFCLKGEEGLLVSVLLTNATGGAPSEANVIFTSKYSSVSFSQGGSASYNLGIAQATFNISSSAEAGNTFKITADATDVDITENQTATGSKTSKKHMTIFTATFQPKFEDPLTLMDETELKVLVEPEEVAQKFTFEIRRLVLIDWATLSQSSENTYDWTARVAGNFLLRAKVETTDDYVHTLLEEQLQVRFPDWGTITSDAAVQSAAAAAWQATLDYASTSQTHIREYGFWVRLNTETGEYVTTSLIAGDSVENNQLNTRPDIELGTRPPDDTPTPFSPNTHAIYTVASFHTHTPITYWNSTAWSRKTGPSEGDESADEAQNVTGIVYDYDTGTGSLFGQHPINHPSKLYKSGPDRRGLN